ncbi:MAG: histidinol-phosphate transaminase [Acidimicrobiia bacterium]
MPHFRSDLEGLVTYVPGRPIEDVAREIGMEPDDIVKLASNESPEGPFPGVSEAIAGVLEGSNRYPDSDVRDLTRAMAADLGVREEQVWFGAGSTGLLGAIALSMGGPGTSAVYAWPSFVMYRIISRWAATEAIEVPLDSSHVHDLDAIRAAIRDDTTVVYLCNPNNPTGTIISGDDLERFVESAPESALVVVDEAYHHFVSDPAYRSFLGAATERPNVLVLRTFSKVYGLAALRIGFAVGDPGLLDKLRRTQAPFTVSSVAQAAAIASLGNEAEMKRRVDANAAGRQKLLGVFSERGLDHADSQTNFVYYRPGGDSAAVASSFVNRGVIVRPLSGGWIRVTIGAPLENERFVSALDGAIAEQLS